MKRTPSQTLLIQNGAAHALGSMPPGGWQRERGEDPLSVLRYPLRVATAPPSDGLNKIPRPSSRGEQRAQWEHRVGKGPGMMTMLHHPKTAQPAWRYRTGGAPPAWWMDHVAERNAPRRPVVASPEAQALKDKIKAALAASLDRVVDTLRLWDADLSGKIDKREFYEACTQGLHIHAPRSAFNELFDIVDADRSGEIDYKELNKVLRRRVEDPSHKDAMMARVRASLTTGGDATSMYNDGNRIHRGVM
jgi:hypothetical protein